MSKTKLIVGLGNPGKKYAETRHNIGFRVLDRLAAKEQCSFKKSKFLAYTAQLKIAGQSVLLAKPTTYMNNSGMAVRELVDYFDIDFEDLLIVYDDADLPLGTIRLRARGGSGGHNGMGSIINHLNSQEFPRLRMGISSEYGRNEMVNFVLSSFSKAEKETVEEMTEKAVDGLVLFLNKPIDIAMNLINSSN